jgi:hypothetical protein
MMKAGDLFRWHEKRVYSSGKVSAAGKVVHVPAHADAACVLHKFEQGRIKRDIESLEDSIARLVEMNAPQIAVDMLRGKLAALRPAA